MALKGLIYIIIALLGFGINPQMGVQAKKFEIPIGNKQRFKYTPSHKIITSGKNTIVKSYTSSSYINVKILFN